MNQAAMTLPGTEKWFAICEAATAGPFERPAQAWSYIEAQLRAGHARDTWDVVARPA